MTYSEALSYIHSLNRFGIKPGLKRITTLLRLLGNPQDDLAVIHVAGTNGKGSTATALSRIMQVAGYQTGLFISPFVVEFCERIQINQTYIPKKDLARWTEKIVPLAERVGAQLGDAVTEFEFITALAFCYFQEQKCERVVLETGLGGRLDSTNVVSHPLCAVLTKIDLDHIAVLGNTIEQIALEKCGIIKPRCPVVVSSGQKAGALSTIQTVAAQKKAPLIVTHTGAVEGLTVAAYGSQFKYRGLSLSIPLAGAHQVENMVTAAETALQLGVMPAAIEEGIAHTVFPARLEVLQQEPLVLLDGAHNQNGAAALSNYLKNFSLSPIAIIGMMQDKDCTAALEQIIPHCHSVITVTVMGNARAAQAETLAELVAPYGKPVIAASNYGAALDMAKEEAKKNRLPILICGSLYLASDIRPLALKALKN